VADEQQQVVAVLRASMLACGRPKCHCTCVGGSDGAEILMLQGEEIAAVMLLPIHGACRMI